MGKKTTIKAASKAPKVYAYGMVSDAMATMVAQMLDVYSTMGDHIDMHVNSIGGSTGHGTAVRNCVKNCDVPVDIYIDGVAASMGAYLALSGRKVYISKYARIMLHEARMAEGGTASELREMADETDDVNNNLVGMVCERTGMSDADVRARFFNGKDNWLSAQEALDLKLVDGIYDLDEVNVPNAANHVEVYAILAEAHSNGVFKTDNYMEFKPAKEVLAAVGLKEGATETEYNMAVLALAKSNNDLTLQAKNDKALAIAKEVNAQDLFRFDNGILDSRRRALADGGYWRPRRRLKPRSSRRKAIH